MRESTIEKKVCEYARSLGWLTYKWTSPGNRDVPDRIFINNGKVIFIEFKAPNKKPRIRQQLVINEILSKNVPVYCIDNELDGKNLFNNCGN